MRAALPLGVEYCVLLIACTLLISPPPRQAVAGNPPETPIVLAEATKNAPTVVTDPLVDLARTNPRAFLQRARERCQREIRDYGCVLLKQERLDGELTQLQRIELRYRAKPHSVYMKWLENPDQARQAAYIRGRDVDEHGGELATVEPAGCILRLFVKKLEVPVNGERAHKASRQTMDDVGYLGTFAALDATNTLAEARGDLQLRYGGTGVLDGRPTYVLTRSLPYTGEGGEYPNAYLVLDLDQQWLLPVGIYMYADAAGQILLGSYEMTQVAINQGYDDRSFAF